ncbi:sulfatase-like hydrolase/transferase [Halobium palmae]|uniref:Sulfatase-like hydrolase/transferase n=1 Tax=Halobium palmae TaxID=1776492 RepID=A0ABD5RVQ3_9EURY
MTDTPNVLFLMTDEHSYRGLGHLDDDGRGEPVNTPTLDDVADSSAVFDQAYCQTPLCTPSRLSMLTGREAPGAGAWDNWSTLLPDRRTMPEAFAEAGYATSLVGKMHFGGNRQFCGFEDRPYGDLTGEVGHQPDPIRPLEENRGLGRPPFRTRTADAGVTEIPESQLQERNVLTESLSWVREQAHANPDQPWFLCASFSRPHFPLTVPERFLDRYWPEGVTKPKVGREGDVADHPVVEHIVDYLRIDDIPEEEAQKARAAYFACIDFVDELIGDFLSLMERGGYLEDTIVVYASDHGELAGEHGLWWKSTWHEASARVPLVVQTPGHRSGEREPARLETPVGLVDLFPTLCGLCGVDTLGEIDGVDLSEAVREGAEPDRGPVVCDHLNPRYGEDAEYRMVRDGRYKYVEFRGEFQELLFDVEADPLETENLALDPSGEDAAALDRLRAYVDETLDFEEAEERRRADQRRAAEDHVLTPGTDSDADVDVSEFRADMMKLQIPETTDGNLYHLPDGRIVDAGLTIYRPEEIIENPAAAYDDWPGSDARPSDDG